MMPTDLIFLHTAAVHIATFDQLISELAPGTPVRHLVYEDLLSEARQSGITPKLQARITETIVAAFHNTQSVLVCTCSTIGAAAEAAGRNLGRSVVRVDRAMAEHALNIGPRIVVIAALESTLEPTRRLVQAVAAERGTPLHLYEVLCVEAWAHFERGDIRAYHAAIAACIRQAAATLSGDSIMLAQASMAGAAILCTEIATPILSSPRLGLEAALAQRGR